MSKKAHRPWNRAPMGFVSDTSDAAWQRALREATSKLDDKRNEPAKRDKS